MSRLQGRPLHVVAAPLANRGRVLLGLVCVLAFGLPACSESEPQPPSPTASGSREKSSDGRPEYRKGGSERNPIDSETVGAVRGIVTFVGEAPERQPLSIGGTAGCHIEGHTPLSERVIVTDGRLANVFVHVSKGLETWVLPTAPAEPLVLDQRGCTYVPHVAGIQVGQTLQVKNSDGATHNVHARSKRNESFNRSQPPGGQVIERVFERREVMLPIVCDIHPWMKTWLGVVEHPFHAVSAEDGSFSIEGLPPGEYTLSFWHEAYDARKVAVTVEPGAHSTVEVAFP